MNEPAESKRKRILHIITRLDLGGSAENTLLTCIGLAQRGYAVDIIAGESENPPSVTEKTAVENGVSITRIPFLTRKIALIRDIMAVIRLYFVIRKGEYDLVHTHTSKAGIVGRFAAALACARLIVHTPHGHIFYGYFSVPLTSVFIIIERMITPFTDKIIALTNQERADMLDRGIGTPDQIVQIFSGIDLDPFLRVTRDGRAAILERYGIGGADFVIGTVARLVPVKNHRIILDAARIIRERCPGVRYFFIGDGELQAALLSEIDRSGLSDRVIMAGWKDRAELLELLPAFDLFVLCSVNEGMGRVFIEAQAAGIPVVGSNVCGIPEVILENETGFCVGIENAGELASKIAWIYENRGNLAAMSVNCREWSLTHFGKDRMVEEIDGLYQELIPV